jgi:predicted nucleotidyltransferase
MRPEKFGINESHWGLISHILLQPIRNAGGRVWVFGSRSRGDYTQFSDLDLLIEGIEDSTLISRMSERLEESTLPFRVDLVRESDLAETYREGVYKERIAVE